MTATNWTELIADMTWRPDTNLTVMEDIRDVFDPVSLMVHMKVEDSYHPGKWISVLHVRQLPFWDQLRDEKTALIYLNDAFHAIDAHESDEWFKYKGEMIFDPHKKEKTNT